MNDKSRPASPGRSNGRYALSSREDLSDEKQRKLYDKIVDGPRKAQAGQVPIADADGRLLGPFGLMTISPSIGEAVEALGVALRFGSSLDTRTRELSILAVAAHHKSEFEWFAHESPARSAGIADSQLDALKHGTEVIGLSAKESAVLDVVRTLLQAQAMTELQYSACMEALDEQMLAELIWLCGYYSMLALSLTVFQPENPLDNNDVEFVSDRVVQPGGACPSSEVQQRLR